MILHSMSAEKVTDVLNKEEFPKHPENLYEPIRYILGLSGKRIRPLLVLLAAELFEIANIDDAVPASVAIEYFHNFSLIHDDIMDKAPLRRGKETVHTKWNDSIAILSGDALLIKAYEQLVLLPPKYIPEAIRVFNKIAVEVCEGQQYDMDFETRKTITQHEYIEMIRLKTSVLLGGALELGSVVADAPLADRKRLYDFGVYLGIAFQLQDDILDVYGDPSTFGKQIGGDIIANKKTILYTLLQSTVEGESEAILDALLLDKLSDPIVKIGQMKLLYEKYHILDKANELKAHYTDLAYTSLKKIEVSELQKEELYRLANNLMKRTQ